jgi:transcriptional regulator with XRE-family HTH domain
MAENAAFTKLRDQAIALRRAGKSRREIKELLAITSNSTLNEVLRGEPPQPWTWRPNAKDELRAKARDLRRQGLDYEEIVAELGVSKSSVSLWVRDMPRPPGLSYEESRKRSADGVRRYWALHGPIREAEREAISAAAAAQIGQLNDRERVTFLNSDPALIKFFLRFLEAADIGREDLVYRVQIHETADVEAAQRFWLDVTQANPSQFRRPTLKRHNPKTVRKNTGRDYHGCLRIDVLRSSALYRQIEGWAAAAMSAGATTYTRPG